MLPLVDKLKFNQLVRVGVIGKKPYLGRVVADTGVMYVRVQADGAVNSVPHTAIERVGDLEEIALAAEGHALPPLVEK